MSNAASSPVRAVQPLGFPWATQDPFLFCAWHDDAYPRGNGRLGPDASLAGRDIGQDFSRKDGWSMYHGEDVPGFPAHPHRGFETVTLVRKGLIDHSDSLGAKARFGGGDVQWVTAGDGIVHSEMFPLLSDAQDNPVELFQIWLNLPRASKRAKPNFTMFWSGDVPRHRFVDAAQRASEVAVVAGPFEAAGVSLAPLAPPPDSWAARAEAEVAIWTVTQDAGARLALPPAAHAQTRRTLYFFRGGAARVAGREVTSPCAIELDAQAAVEIEAGGQAAEWLVLQGRPIDEPVAQYGPFVMNTQAEIVEAMNDYRRTGFGGWPFESAAPTHGATLGRFAEHPGGRREEPEPLAQR